MGADDAERYMMGRQLIVKDMQHSRPRQIDVGRSREIAGNQLDTGRFTKRIQNRFQNRLGVDVEQRGLRTECDDADQRLHAFMPGTIRIAAGSRKTAEKRDIRLRRASQQQEYGSECRKQDSLQDSKE